MNPKFSFAIGITTASLAVSINLSATKPAQALTSIYNPTPTANTNTGTITTNFGSLAATANGNGLSGIGDILNQTHRAGGSSADFWSAALTNATPNDVNLDFNFGSVVTVNTLALWNYNAFNSVAVDRGIRDFNLILSNNSDFSNPVYTSNLLTLAKGIGTGPIPSTLYSFSSVSAQYARIDVSTNWGGNGIIGLSEVRFADVQTVPFEVPGGPTIPVMGSMLALGAMRKLRKTKVSNILAGE